MSSLPHKAIFVLALGFAVGIPSVSRGTTIGQEDQQTGFVGNVIPPPFFPPIFVASNGELSFRPFGAQFDVGDAIQFAVSGVWIPDMSLTSHWQKIVDPNEPNSDTWVLPLSYENALGGDEVGRWIVQNAHWQDEILGAYEILNPDGTVSDTITLANDAPGQSASVSFNSDPISSSPDAGSTFLLLSAGVLSLSVLRRKLFT